MCLYPAFVTEAESAIRAGVLLRSEQALLVRSDRLAGQDFQTDEGLVERAVVTTEPLNRVHEVFDDHRLQFVGGTAGQGDSCL